MLILKQLHLISRTVLQEVQELFSGSVHRRVIPRKAFRAVATDIMNRKAVLLTEGSKSIQLYWDIVAPCKKALYIWNA
jgi:predicted acylesterase/phospholipase RssA